MEGVYKKLQDLVSNAEGTDDARARQEGFDSGYDVPFGYGNYLEPDKPLTEMTFREIKAYQRRLTNATKGTFGTRKGKNLGTSAVGKYQFIAPTLEGLRTKLGYKLSDTFSPEVQDRLFAELMREAGVEKLTQNKMSREKFQERLSLRYPSIPLPGKSAGSDPDQSVRITSGDVETVLDSLAGPVVPEEGRFPERATESSDLTRNILNDEAVPPEDETEVDTIKPEPKPGEDIRPEPRPKEGRENPEELQTLMEYIMGIKQAESKPKLKEGGTVKQKEDKADVKEKSDVADPPPGATPEEVADDIPAYLSTGEYVLPANVVRYIGLSSIVDMHKNALSSLQQMEDLNLITNVDENGKVEQDDKETRYLEPSSTTVVIAKPHPSGMMARPFQQGGDVSTDYEYVPGVGYITRGSSKKIKPVDPIGSKELEDPDKVLRDEEKTSDAEEDTDYGKSTYYEGTLEERKDFGDLLTGEGLKSSLARGAMSAAELVEKGLMSGPFGAARAAQALGLSPGYPSEIGRQRDYFEELSRFDKEKFDALKEVEERTGERPDIGNLTGFELGYASRAQEDAEARAEDEDDYSEDEYDESDTGVGGGAELQKGGFIRRKKQRKGLMR